MPEYKPYGEEWKQAMMKHTKREIVDILGEEIQKLRAEMEEVRRASREANTAVSVYVERCAVLEREIEKLNRRQDDGADAKWN